MRVVLFFLIILIISGCDSDRLYEKNYDFDEQAWLSSNQPAFEFSVRDTLKTFNLLCNVRNSAEYPFSRIFINYSLQDSAGVSLSHNMISTFLFEEKTGKPLGNSGLGDVYDHQIPILKNFQFKKAGMYSIRFDQFMRTDTLSGILAVGFRLEEATAVIE